MISNASWFLISQDRYQNGENKKTTKRFGRRQNTEKLVEVVSYVCLSLVGDDD